MATFFFQLTFHRLHDVVINQRLSASDALPHGYEHFLIRHALSIVRKHDNALELFVKLFDFAAPAAVVVKLRPLDSWLDLDGGLKPRSIWLHDFSHQQIVCVVAGVACPEVSADNNFSAA